MRRRTFLRQLSLLSIVSPIAQFDRERALDAATIAALSEIRGAEEQRFKLHGDASDLVTVQGRQGRRSTSWFSYEMPVDRSNAVAVVVTYNTKLEWFCQFTVTVDGERVGEEFMSPREEARFFDIHYGVPGGVATGKDVITVRFDAIGGDAIAPVFGLRTIRA